MKKFILATILVLLAIFGSQAESKAQAGFSITVGDRGYYNSGYYYGGYDRPYYRSYYYDGPRYRHHPYWRDRDRWDDRRRDHPRRHHRRHDRD